MPAIDELLSRAASSVANPSAAQEDAIARLMALQARLEEGALRVAVLGQFKRGKSTLLNLTASQTRSATATLVFGAAQHGQRGKLRASATAIRLCRLAIEFATWRSGRIGGASGSVTSGNGRFFEPRGEGRS